MGLGRTWHRVEELSGDGRYEVETAVATAVVRGTAFVIDCPSETECTFTVLEGAVEVIGDGENVTVEAGESVTVTDDEISAPVLIDGAPLEEDAWLARNAGLDVDAGFGDLDGSSGSGESEEGTAIDLENLDVCSMLDTADVETLLGRSIEAATTPTNPIYDTTCLWDAGWVEVPSKGQYRVSAQLDVKPGPSLPNVSAGEECVERSLDGLGRAASAVECAPLYEGDPGGVSILVHLAGDVLVTLHINPDRPLSLAEARDVVEDVIGQLR